MSTESQHPDRPNRFRRSAVMLLVFLSVCLVSYFLTTSSTYRRFRAETLPVQWTTADVPVEEPSGLIYHPDRQTLFVVSDEGYLAELTTDLKPISRYDIAADLEGIALHPVTGNLFISAEVPLAVFEFDPNQNRVIRRMDVDLKTLPDFKNKTGDREGLEGVTILPHRTDGWRLFVVVQANPPRIVELDADLSVAATDRARQSNPADPFGLQQSISAQVAIDPRLPSLSDLGFHADTNQFLVMSSQDRTLALVDRQGAIRRTIRLPGPEPEGLAFLPDGRAILCDDTGGVRIAPDVAKHLFKPLSP